MITNNKDLEFKSIDHEVYREYTFNNGVKVKINNPLWLNVSASNGHRILDAKGVSHYIPSGWIHLTWEVSDGVNFRF
jgi:hypothetical protein